MTCAKKLNCTPLVRGLRETAAGGAQSPHGSWIKQWIQAQWQAFHHVSNDLDYLKVGSVDEGKLPESREQTRGCRSSLAALKSHLFAERTSQRCLATRRRAGGSLSRFARMLTQKLLDHKLRRERVLGPWKALQGHSRAAGNRCEPSFLAPKDQWLNENWSK
jgi:hypothetical protein